MQPIDGAMASSDDAQFLVAYIHVARTSVAAAIEALGTFHSSPDAQACHVACLQREGHPLYSNQFVLFIAAPDPQQLLKCTSAACFAALVTAVDAARIAPTIIKKFRSVVPMDFSSRFVHDMARHFTVDSTPSFSVTHLDVIPSIPGNVDRAHALLVAEVAAVTGEQQQQQQQEAAGSGNGCFMFCALQQTDRANHFTLVQVSLLFFSASTRFDSA